MKKCVCFSQKPFEKTNLYPRYMTNHSLFCSCRVAKANSRRIVIADKTIVSSLKNNFHVKESRCFFIEQLIRKYPISEYDKGTEKTAAVKTLEEEIIKKRQF